MPSKDNGDRVAPEPPLDTPALRDDELNFSYAIGRGEMGVLSFEPYKGASLPINRDESSQILGLILPYWAFRTVPIASNSAEVLWDIFRSFCSRGDFVGADMARKFIQMGMTRAKRYANHKGGRKYGEDGKQLAKWTGDDADGKRREKEEASEIFKRYWKRCTAHEEYLRLKQEWMESKARYLKRRAPEDRAEK